MKVFISSVRRDLETERDSLPALLEVAGYEPVRFEDFTSQPNPTRKACVAAVNSAQACVLLLGPAYGHILPETGKSATEEEYSVAKRNGIPILVFHKLGVEFEEAQEEFARRVEDYSTGRYRDTFTAAADLQTKVLRALKMMSTDTAPLEWVSLSEAIAIDTESAVASHPNDSRPTLGLHLTPIDRSRLSTMQLRDLTGRIESAIRESNAIPQSIGISSSHISDRVISSSLEQPRWNNGITGVTEKAFGGIAVLQSGQVSAWSFLARDFVGSIVSESTLAAELSSLFQIINQIDVLGDQNVVPVVSLTHADAVGLGEPSDVGRRQGGRLSMHGPKLVQTDADDFVPARALSTASKEVADELARRVTLALTTLQ